MSAARLLAGRCVNRNAARGVQAPPPTRLQRRVDWKAPEAQLPVGADVGVDPAAGVAPNAGFTVRFHQLPGSTHLTGSVNRRGEAGRASGDPQDKH